MVELIAVSRVGHGGRGPNGRKACAVHKTTSLQVHKAQKLLIEREENNVSNAHSPPVSSAIESI